MSTLIGVFGWKASQAQPEMVEQFVVSCRPLYAGAMVTVKKPVVEATAPWLSVALAVGWYCPAGTLLQMTLYGAAVAVILDPGVKYALLAGAVKLTVGNALRIKVTGAEVVMAPLLSVARAVSVCVPAAEGVNAKP